MWQLCTALMILHCCNRPTQAFTTARSNDWSSSGKIKLAQPVLLQTWHQECHTKMHKSCCLFYHFICDLLRNSQTKEGKKNDWHKTWNSQQKTQQKVLGHVSLSIYNAEVYVYREFMVFSEAPSNIKVNVGNFFFKVPLKMVLFWDIPCWWWFFQKQKWLTSITNHIYPHQDFVDSMYFVLPFNP